MRIFILTIVCILGCAGAPVSKSERPADPGALLFNGQTNRSLDCYRCHGSEAQGLSGGGPGLAYRVPKLSDDDIAKVIKNGKRNMPGYAGKISESELASIRSWLRASFP